MRTHSAVLENTPFPFPSFFLNIGLDSSQWQSPGLFSFFPFGNAAFYVIICGIFILLITLIKSCDQTLSLYLNQREDCYHATSIFLSY